jgi:mRNA interferase MazF
MRPIHLARLDKNRPALVLTRPEVRPYLRAVTIAPITTRIRDLTTEVAVGTANGLAQPSVVNCDNITTTPVENVGRLLGYLLPEQERDLARAIAAAFALESE